MGRPLVKQLSYDSSNLLNLLIHKNTANREIENFNSFTGSLINIDRNWFNKYPPDVIFHLARSAGSNYLTRQLYARMGKFANYRLVKRLASLGKPPIVVYVSGSLMYGNRSIDSPATEDSLLSPESYARYYFHTEQPWIEAQRKRILDIRFARPGWIVGPSSWFLKFFWLPFLNNGKIPCYGDGNQYMSIVHLSDFARLTESLYLKGDLYQNLNIYSCPPIMQMEFSGTLAEIMGAGVEYVSYGQTCNKYGYTTARALTSSIPMQTNYRHIHDNSGIQFKSVREILVNITGILEHKE